MTYEREQRYYPTDFVLTKAEFEGVMSNNTKGDFKDIKLRLSKIEEHARSIIKDMPEFTFDVFERLLTTPKGNLSLVTYYNHYINELKSEGRVGTYENYQTSVNSLLRFAQKKELFFKEVTVKFLNQYESWMLKNGNSFTTVGIYLRPLRGIFNRAIKEQVISNLLYPFGKDKYQIPAEHNIKKALKIIDLEQLFNYKTILGATEDWARDLWFFTYLCNGINVKDICRLRYSNINFDDGTIVFVRAKTERTRRSNIKPIIAILTDEVRTIIEKWGNKPQLPNSYVSHCL